MNKLINLLGGTDKILHCTVSATIAHLLIVVGCAWWLAAAITLSIGIGKEIYDKHTKEAAMRISDCQLTYTTCI